MATENRAILILVKISLVAAYLTGTGLAYAQQKGKSSGLPLPRFVTLKAKRINMRVGPGVEYGVQWRYQRPGLPVEIVQEFDRWRQIRDSTGTQGWIHQSLLSGKRSAIILATDPKADRKDTDKYPVGYKSASKKAAIVARFQPGAIVEIIRCDGKWCSLKLEKNTAFVEQSVLWGAYPGEEFEG